MDQSSYQNFSIDLKEYQVVGRPIPNIDGISKATGAAKYAVDVILPNMLYGKILRSPYAHARILNINISLAKKLKGVKGVITGNDIPKRKYGGIPFIPETVDEYVLAQDKVRYVGDEIAAVAAIDEETAQEAIGLIDVEYEILCPVFDPLEAMSVNAPKIHDVPRNIGMEVKMEFGNVEKGFQESDYIREDEFTTQMLCHCALEPHASLACVDPSGKITVWAATQSSYLLQYELSQMLAVPMDRIRILKTYVGGSFGGKNEMLAPEICSVLLSMKTQKPVKIAYCREEEFITTRHKHPTIIKIKTGVKKDGTIMAKDCNAIMDGGAYNSFGPYLVGRIGSQISLVYRVPNIRFKGYRVYTNKPVCGAMRGVTNFQARFADDSQMDIIARDLGLDPIDIRLKNARQQQETTPHGWKVTTCGLKECIKKIAEKKEIIQRTNDSSEKKIGVGVSCWGYYTGARAGHSASAIFIKLNENGMATLITGAEEIGQGAHTILCQIAAEELGVSLDRIKIITGDTDITPIDLGSWLSRTTCYTGNAVREAALDCKNQLFEVISEKLEADKNDLVAKNNRIYVLGSPERYVTVEDAIKFSLYEKGRPIVGKGYYNPDIENIDPRTDLGNIGISYAFGAVLAEVEVDPKTGLVAVNRIVSATDCGYPINPMASEGQIEGAIVMGMGGALFEELKIENGVVLNPSFLDYKVVKSVDAPEMETFLVKTDDPCGPFGAKGIGEGAAIPAAPAIANAIYDAIGVRIKSLPITPEKIVEALKNETYYPNRKDMPTKSNNSN